MRALFWIITWAMLLALIGCGQAPTETPTTMPALTLSPDSTPQVDISLRIELDKVEVSVGDTLTVTATLEVGGDVACGMPQLRVSASRDCLEPNRAEETIHVAVSPGDILGRDFTFEAVEPGVATLNATVSCELHFGYPGPATWGGANALPVTVTITE